MEFMDLMKARESTRTFSPDPVPEEKLNLILESGRLAPSWANKQCWHFIFVKDKDIISKLAKEACANNKFVGGAPIIIVGCGDPKLSGSRNDMQYYLVDVAIALEHMMLAATSEGLGTCWIGIFDEAKAKEILKIPNDIKVVALTPLGFPAHRESIREKITKFVIKSKTRKPMNEILHNDKW